MISGYGVLTIKTISGKKKFIGRDFRRTAEIDENGAPIFKEIFFLVDKKESAREIHMDVKESGDVLPSNMARIYDKSWAWVVLTVAEVARQVDIPIDSFRIEKTKYSEAKQQEIDNEYKIHLEKWKNSPDNPIYTIP